MTQDIDKTVVELMALVDATLKVTAAYGSAKSVHVVAQRYETEKALRTALTEAAQVPVGMRLVPEVPHPGGVIASALLDSELAAYGWPSNSKNAARAGWEACRKYMISAAPSTPPKE